MTSQRPHPRRTAPTGAPFPPRTLRRQNAQILLPEDFIHEAGRPPVPFPDGVQEDDEPDSPPRGQGISRGVYARQPPIPLQGDEPSVPTRQGTSRRLYTSRPPTHLHDDESEVTPPGRGRGIYGSSSRTAPDDEDRLIQRNIEVFRRRLRAGLLAPVSHPSQRTSRRPLLFQEQPSRQSRRRPRSPSPIPRPSRRRRVTLTSDDSCIEVALPEAAASAARRSHAAGPGPEAEPGNIPLPPPSIPIISNERLAEIGPRTPTPSEIAAVVHLLRLPNAPQADPFRPPPPYSPRIPRLHPTAEDYDLRANNFGRTHNNGAPPLPVYTPVAGPSERVLQFGGSEDEQRNALVRLLQERNFRGGEGGMEEVGRPSGEEERLPAFRWPI